MKPFLFLNNAHGSQLLWTDKISVLGSPGYRFVVARSQPKSPTSSLPLSKLRCTKQPFPNSQLHLYSHGDLAAIFSTQGCQQKASWGTFTWTLHTLSSIPSTVFILKCFKIPEKQTSKMWIFQSYWGRRKGWGEGEEESLILLWVCRIMLLLHLYINYNLATISTDKCLHSCRKGHIRQSPMWKPDVVLISKFTHHRYSFDLQTLVCCIMKPTEYILRCFFFILLNQEFSPYVLVPANENVFSTEDIIW